MGDQLCDRRDTTVMNTHDLRQKHPQGHRGIVNSCRAEDRGCVTKDRLNRFFGDQRRKVQVATLSNMLDTVTKRIIGMMAHGGFLAWCVWAVRFPNSSQVKPLSVNPTKNPDIAKTCSRLSAIRRGHVFYQRLNELLHEAKFDRFVKDSVAELYASDGMPGVGVYFRMLFIGYFEGIAWISISSARGA